VVDAANRRRLRIAGAAALVVALVVVLVLALNRPDDSNDSPPAAASSVPFETIPVSSELRWPASVSGRKILDQNGDVYLMRTFSSWAIPMNLTDVEITTALEGVAGRGFNAVTVWAGGGYDIGEGWNRYSTAEHGDWWTGTPWASDLGPGWEAMDLVMDEARRLGLTVNFSFPAGYGDTGAKPDWERATDEDLYGIGVAVANRYADYPNLVWHIMFDDVISATTAARVNALFDGINDTEGEATRPVRWAEPDNLTTVYNELIGPDLIPSFGPSMNGFYDNWLRGTNSESGAELVEESYNEPGATSFPTGDTETAYDSSPLIDIGDVGQQLRERSYAVFLEGGSYINYSHEDWWPFGAQGWVDSTEDLDWDQVPDHVHTVQAQHVWKLIDEFVADPTWVPDDESFLTSGTASGDDKAAVGRSETAAIAYFPSARDVVVDTTVLEGEDPVRLRWYDPTTGEFTDVVATEPQQADRSVTYPAAHDDSTNDWALVVDLATGTATGTSGS
jgi:hypothetical protein